MSTIKEHTLAIVNELLDKRIADNKAPFLITETELFSAIRESINQLCRENELLFGKTINLIYLTNKKCKDHESNICNYNSTTNHSNSSNRKTTKEN
jgi:hypothetical protein